jgi:hypothetical protein
MDMPLDETPPPLPSHLAAKPGSGWPKTLGIITIVFGSLGSLGGLAAFVTPIFLKQQMQPYVQMGADPAAVAAYVEKMMPYQIIMAVLTLSAGLLLLFGGLNLIKKRPVAVKLLLVWAFCKIGIGIYSTIQGIPMAREQMEIMQSSSAFGSEGGAALGQITSVATTIGMIVSLVWIAVLPVFLMVWFSRAKTREQVNAW